MTLQWILDGVIAAATLALGATGVTLTYSNLRFANFAHGEFISWGAYLALTLAALAGSVFGTAEVAGPFSFGGRLLLAAGLAAALTGVIALVLDMLVFRRLRARGAARDRRSSRPRPTAGSATRTRTRASTAPARRRPRGRHATPFTAPATT